jgi:hypothetical protein
MKPSSFITTSLASPSVVAVLAVCVFLSCCASSVNCATEVNRNVNHGSQILDASGDPSLEHLKRRYEEILSWNAYSVPTTNRVNTEVGDEDDEEDFSSEEKALEMDSIEDYY